MEAVLAQLQALGNSKRFIPAEEVLMNVLQDLDPYLTSSLKKEKTGKI